MGHWDRDSSRNGLCHATQVLQVQLTVHVFWCSLLYRHAMFPVGFRREVSRLTWRCAPSVYLPNLRLVSQLSVRTAHAAKRQGPCTRGPICPDALAGNLVQLNVRDLEAWFNGVIRPLAQAGMLAAKVTGIDDATDLETTARYEGCGQVTRTRKITDKRGKVHEIEVTVDGWKLMVLIEARTKLPLAATVVPIQEYETLALRALVT